MKRRPWTVATHRRLAPVTDGLWRVDAELAVLPIGRRMTIVRLASGDVIVHNVIACDEPTMAAIDAVGPVRWIVVPSAYHTMDAHAYAERYPEARVITPAASAKRVGQRCRLDGTLDLLPSDPALAWEPIAGVPAEAVLIHRDRAGASTLIFNDAVMNLPARLPGFKGFVVKLIGSTGGVKVTRTAKFFIVKDRPAFADHLRRLAALPGLARMIVSHGDLLSADVGAPLAAAADRLSRARTPRAALPP